MYSWMPYKEFLAIESIEPNKEKITLEKIKQIIDSTNSFDDAFEEIAEIQKIPDVACIGVEVECSYQYWLDDDGSKVIVINPGLIFPEQAYSGEKKIKYVEKVLVEGAWRDSESEILAEYDEEHNRITGKTYEKIKHDIIKLPEFKDLYDWEESEKIRSELSDEQRKAQKDIGKYIGYNNLTEEQYKALSEIEAESAGTDKKYILKMLAAIGEADLQHRLTLDEVKSIISDIDDIDSYQFNDVILMISNELKYRKYYPDFTQKYFFQDEYFKVKAESLKEWYWLDDNETKCIVITFGVSVVYGEMKDGELEVIEALFDK